MKPISAYSQDDFLRLVLQGPPGTGKTVKACQFPGSAIVNLDRNLGGPIRFMQEHNLTLPVGFVEVDTDDNGQPVPLNLRYQRMSSEVGKLAADNSIGTIVIDSASNLAPLLQQEVLRQQGKTKIEDFKDGRQFWGFFYTAGMQLMSQLTQIRKHVVLIAHEVLDKDEKGNPIYPVKVNWPGRLGEIIGVFFTDVWRCEVDTEITGKGTMWKFKVRTMPDARYVLKNSMGLPPVFEFDWKIIEEKLKRTIVNLDKVADSKT